MNRRPVMLFAGDFWNGSTESGLAAGFRNLGWAVQEIDRGRIVPNPGSDLISRLAARAFRSHGAANYRRSILDACRNLRPTVLMTVKGVLLGRDLLENARELGVRTVMYYPDYHFDYPGVDEDAFHAYDLFVTTKSFQVAELRRRLGEDRVAYVPHGYVDSVHRPIWEDVAEADYRTDVLHAGTRSHHKQAWFGALARLAPDARMTLIGNGWGRRGAQGPLSGAQVVGPRFGVAYAEAAQLARINVAVLFGSNGTGWQDLVSTRTFELPACRAFMLHVDNEEVREFFEPGREIDVFASPEELADKVRYYLARPDLRAAMIERAYARCVPGYGYSEKSRAVHTLMLDTFAI